MKKTLAYMTFLSIMGITQGYACPELSVEQTEALIQNQSYTDNKGIQWNLETTSTAQEGSKVPIDFFPLLDFLKKPGIMVRLVKSTFQKHPPSSNPAPLMNARLQKKSCDYAVMKSAESSDTLTTQELYEFRLNRK